MGCIYMWTNNKNSKCYIGQCSRKIERRQKEHIAGRGSKLLKCAIDKYGIENFTFEILHDGIIPEFLDTLEREAIAKFNALVPHGYNLDTGGATGRPSAETRRKQSKAKKGKKRGPHSAEHRKNLSKAHTGKKYGHQSEEHRRKIAKSNTGKKHSKKTRLKISKARKGKKLSEETRRKISKSKLGKKQPSRSKKHCENLSRSLKGKPIHLNTLKALHSKNATRKMSETKLGMSQEAFTILIGWLLRAGWSQSKIARELRKNRGTVRRYKNRDHKSGLYGLNIASAGLDSQ